MLRQTKDEYFGVSCVNHLVLYCCKTKSIEITQKTIYIIYIYLKKYKNKIKLWDADALHNQQIINQITI